MHWETVCSIALSLESSVDVGQWWYQHRLGGLDRDPRNPMSGGSLFIDRWWSSGISTIHTVQVLATYTIWYSTNGIVVSGRVKKKGKEKKKEKKEEICKRTTELQKKEAKVQKKKWTKKVSSVVTLPTCKSWPTKYERNLSSVLVGHPLTWSNLTVQPQPDHSASPTHWFVSWRSSFHFTTSCQPCSPGTSPIRSQIVSNSPITCSPPSGCSRSPILILAYTMWRWSSASFSGLVLSFVFFLIPTMLGPFLFLVRIMTILFPLSLVAWPPFRITLE